jgi:NADH-quinone oxidoreductase subunit L
MLVTVLLISLLVQVSAMEGMRREPGFTRFYTVIGFATFAMAGVVVSISYFQLFFFWELLTVAGVMLVGHLWKDAIAAAAARQTLLWTLVGDAGLLVGIAFIYLRFDDLTFAHIHYTAGKSGSGALLVMALLVLLGAAGKSAQVPLQSWLAHTSEASAPAAAMVQASGMTVAGCYLVARAFPLFLAAPGALLVMGVVGGVTAVLAALWALAQDDLRKLLTYLTMSEAGVVFLAFGAGVYSAGVFHLFTQVWARALLFITCGSLIQVMRSPLMSEMGGLWQRLPRTRTLLLVGACAAAGLPGVGTFFSRSGILASGGNPWEQGAQLAVQFLVSLGLFRMMFMVFAGSTARRRRFDTERIREGTLPAGVTLLAAIAAVVGFAGVPGWRGNIFGFLALHGTARPAVISAPALILCAAASLSGLLAAYALYAGRLFPSLRAASLAPLRKAFFLDRVYAAIFRRGVLPAAAGLGWVDEQIVDRPARELGTSVGFLGASGAWASRIRLSHHVVLSLVGVLLLAAVAAAAGAFR